MASRGFVIYDREIRYFIPVLFLIKTTHKLQRLEIGLKWKKLVGAFKWQSASVERKKLI